MAITQSGEPIGSYPEGCGEGRELEMSRKVIRPTFDFFQAEPQGPRHAGFMEETPRVEEIPISFSFRT